MNFLLLFLTLLIILILGHKSQKKVTHLNQFSGDFIGHYSLVKVINRNNNKIKLKPSIFPKGINLIKGTIFYHWFIANLPRKYHLLIFTNHHIYLLLISYSFFAVLYLVKISDNSIGMIYFVLFSILLLFAPFQYNYEEARNSFSVRPVGDFLLSLAFIVYSYYSPEFSLSYFVVFILFCIANLISKFSRQVALFSVLPITIINSDIFYFISILFSFIVPILTIKDFRSNLQSHYFHLLYLWKKLYHFAIDTGTIPYSIKTLLAVTNLKNLVRILPRTGFIIIFVDYPIIWLSVLLIFINRDISIISSIILSILSISVLISFGKFRVVGEGKRYLDYIYILSVFYCINNASFNSLVFIAVLSTMISLVYIYAKSRILKVKQIKKDNYQVENLIQFIENDSHSIYYSLPNRSGAIIEAFSQHQVVCPIGLEPLKNGFEIYDDLLLNAVNGKVCYEIKSEKIEMLRQMFKTNRLLVSDPYYLEETVKALLIFKNDKFKVYSF